MLGLGWRWVFYICGAVGIIWAVAWYLTYRNMPEEHPLVGSAELGHIRGVDENGNVKQVQIELKTVVPWATLLKSPNMWAVMCAYFTYVYCLWIFLTWLPTYLIEYRQFTLLKGGLLASLPLWAGVVGDTMGGVLTDSIFRRTRDLKKARRNVIVAGFLGSLLFLLPILFVRDLTLVDIGLDRVRHHL